MKKPKVVKKNPNAAVAGGTSVIALALIYVAGLAGVELTAEGAALIVAAVTTIALAVGKNRPAK